jgi:hypothetical protein
VGRLGRGTAVVLIAGAAETPAEPETHERLVCLCWADAGLVVGAVN